MSRFPADSTANAQQRTWLLHSSRLKGRLVDISMNGIAFLSPEPIKGGETILLRLSNARFDKCLDTVAQVVRVSPNENGAWRMVCRFRENLTFEQVNSFGMHLPACRFV